MNIIRKSRGTELPKQAQRVFLNCNISNIADRDELISDLLSMDAGMDCVVSYIESPDDSIDEEQLRQELHETQLLVIWVTPELLQSITPEKRPVEYRIAQEFHNPILPILNDDGLFPFYKEKFDSIHCIAKLDNEYRIKLKAQMDTLLASEEIIRRIREKAFSATVFASYRKEELSEVRRFMKAFHDLKGFESVSVWYDNFLPAGENFDKELEEAITNSDALILVVTPALATEGNYVQRKEYPFAKEIGKSVVAVEVISTSHDQFSNLFPDAGCPILLENIIAIQTAFRNALGASTFSERLDSERAYLLGMAYLRGIGVERDFDRAVRLLETATEDYTMSSIEAVEQLASIYEKGIGTNVNLNKALQWYERDSTICEKVLGKDHPDTAASYNNFASVYDSQGNYSNALEWYKKALAIYEKVLGKDHPDTAINYNNIAAVYNSQGEYTKALEWYQKALTICEKMLSREHLSTAITYNNIADVYNNQGEYTKALEWYQKALAIHEKVLGKEHPNTANIYNNIAYVYNNQGEYTKALEWYQKALAIFKKVLGKEHPDTAMAYNNIALVYNNEGEYAKALEWYEKALDILEKVLGKEHPNTAAIYNNIADVYSNQGEYIKALEWYEKALTVCEKVLGKENPSTAATYNNIAFAYSHQSENAKALEWYQKALTICEDVLGKEHPYTGRVYNNIVNVYYNQGEFAKALEWYEKALAIRI